MARVDRFTAILKRNAMADFIYELILLAKYLSVALLMFIFPSETVMPVVGYIASLGHLSLPVAIIAGTIGTTLWASIIYGLARRIGRDAVYRFVKKYGRFLGISRGRIDKAGKWFDRHAGATVFGGRFVSGFRTAVSIPAGFRRMPFRSFVIYTALGSGIDSAFLAYLGFTAHSHFDDLRMLIDTVSNGLVCGLLVLVLAWILWRYYRRRIRR